MSTGRSIHAMPSITPSPREGIEDGPRLRVRTRSNRAGRGPTRGPPGPAELWGARALHPDEPQNDVAVALAGAAQRAQPVDNRPVQPDELFAALVGLVLVSHAAERERPGNRFERVDADRDADLARSRGRDEGVRCRQFHRHVAAIAPCPDDMTRRFHPVERSGARPYARRLACPPIALQACRQTTPRSWRRSARGSIAGWPRSSARLRPSPRRAASRALAGNWRSKRERPWNCE